MIIPRIGKCEFSWKPTCHRGVGHILWGNGNGWYCFHWLGWYLDLTGDN